jgi:putative NIF3 family GTP cyclohydrolase 1 type 2
MKARELREYLQTLDGGWVDWNRTVDTFKAGDPETEIIGIAVGWMSYARALEKALALGCNLFVTHEPTYYDHLDQDEEVFRFERARDKRRFVVESRLVILRCHDLWDQVPGIGIPDSWARQLGFAAPVAGEGYYRVYDVSGRTALDVARQVAARTRELGQEAVQLLGPAEAPVSRVAIGTGAITPFQHYLEEYGVDLAICTDDGFSYWRDGGLAIDMALPVIVVNHAVAEINGMRLLADHLEEKFPELPVRFIPQSCMFRLVEG